MEIRRDPHAKWNLILSPTKRGCFWWGRRERPIVIIKQINLHKFRRHGEAWCDDDVNEYADELIKLHFAGAGFLFRAAVKSLPSTKIVFDAGAIFFLSLLASVIESIDLCQSKTTHAAPVKRTISSGERKRVTLNVLPLETELWYKNRKFAIDSALDRLLCFLNGNLKTAHKGRASTFHQASPCSWHQSFFRHKYNYSSKASFYFPSSLSHSSRAKLNDFHVIKRCQSATLYEAESTSLTSKRTKENLCHRLLSIKAAVLKWFSYDDDEKKM